MSRGHVRDLVPLVPGRSARVLPARPVSLRGAVERGDRLGATCLRSGIFNGRWLIADDPTRARAEASEALGGWSRQGHHVQHFLDLWATAQHEPLRGPEPRDLPRPSRRAGASSPCRSSACSSTASSCTRSRPAWRSPARARRRSPRDDRARAPGSPGARAGARRLGAPARAARARREGRDAPAREARRPISPTGPRAASRRWTWRCTRGGPSALGRDAGRRGRAEGGLRRGRLDAGAGRGEPRQGSRGCWRRASAPSRLYFAASSAFA